MYMYMYISVQWWKTTLGIQYEMFNPVIHVVAELAVIHLTTSVSIILLIWIKHTHSAYQFMYFWECTKINTLCRSPETNLKKIFESKIHKSHADTTIHTVWHMYHSYVITLDGSNRRTFSVEDSALPPSAGRASTEDEWKWTWVPKCALIILYIYSELRKLRRRCVRFPDSKRCLPSSSGCGLAGQIKITVKSLKTEGWWQLDNVKFGKHCKTSPGELDQKRTSREKLQMFAHSSHAFREM